VPQQHSHVGNKCQRGGVRSSRLALSCVIASLVGCSPQRDRGGVTPQQSHPSACPITIARGQTFSPGPPFPQLESDSPSFWYGTDGLWTRLPTTGTWQRLPRNASGYRQKLFFWSRGYNGSIERARKLAVDARVIDMVNTSAYVVAGAPASNAELQGGWAMVTDIDIPSLGCWKITATYGAAQVSFVILITN
jgi:hypothetical protein